MGAGEHHGVDLGRRPAGSAGLRRPLRTPPDRPPRRAIWLPPRLTSSGAAWRSRRLVAGELGLEVVDIGLADRRARCRAGRSRRSWSSPAAGLIAGTVPTIGSSSTSRTMPSAIGRGGVAGDGDQPRAVALDQPAEQARDARGDLRARSFRRRAGRQCRRRRSPAPAGSSLRNSASTVSPPTPESNSRIGAVGSTMDTTP